MHHVQSSSNFYDGESSIRNDTSFREPRNAFSPDNAKLPTLQDNSIDRSLNSIAYSQIDNKPRLSILVSARKLNLDSKRNSANKTVTFDVSSKDGRVSRVSRVSNAKSVESKIRFRRSSTLLTSNF